MPTVGLDMDFGFYFCTRSTFFRLCYTFRFHYAYYPLHQNYLYSATLVTAAIIRDYRLESVFFTYLRISSFSFLVKHLLFQRDGSCIWWTAVTL
jgi:hypothetical protein